MSPWLLLVPLDRATTGAENWLRVRGYISTVRKHGDDVLAALRDAVTGTRGARPFH